MKVLSHTSTHRRTVSLIASILLPFALQAALAVLARPLHLDVSPAGAIWVVAVNVGIGFSCLVFALRWMALILAPFYLVLMALALVGVSLAVAGNFYGDWL